MFIEYRYYTEEDIACHTINLESVRRMFPTPIRGYWTIVIEFPDVSYHVGAYNRYIEAADEINEILCEMGNGTNIYKIIDDFSLRSGWDTSYYFDEVIGKWELPQEQKQYEVSIDELNLSLRTYNCLCRSGIETIPQLTEWSKKRLKKTRGLGDKSLKEIIDRLNLLGLSLKQDDEDD